MEATVAFLNGLSSKVFWSAAVVFIVLNGAAIAAIALSRSRRLVNDWTGKLVAADAVLLGVGLGIPVLIGLAKIGVRAVGSLLGSPPVTTP